jgi:hypothetical protein
MISSVIIKIVFSWTCARPFFEPSGRTFMTKPKYLDKHPCAGCGTGYGECAQYAVMSSRCCEKCSHPTRWQPNPWTAEDFAEFEAVRAERAEQTP